MRTNIDLNDDLVNEAFKLCDAKTKKELIHLALKEFIENHNRKNIMDLKGKIHFDKKYDHKNMRKG